MKLSYENGKPIVEVLIFRSRSSVRYKGFLDTGASLTSVKLEDVEKLELEHVGAMPIYTAAGNLIVDLYLAKAALLGREFEITVFPLSIPSEYGFNCLIGMNIMRHFKITFDNKQQMLEIE
jgi:predicted aspartyl protease